MQPQSNRRSPAAPGPTPTTKSLACALLLGASAVAWAQTQPQPQPQPQPQTASEEDNSGSVLQEITVTATRNEESLNRVPISVSVETRDAMDIKGIKDFSDVVRFTPGVTFDTNETNAIAIRGIASSGGSGTTGIYIDDVPVQMRALGFNPDDTLIKVFDLDRIEVLRGPQGTTFGAGSEGGTVRYITSQPNLNASELYARAAAAASLSARAR